MKKIIGIRGVLEVIVIFAAVMLAGALIAAAAVRTSSVSILYDTLSAPTFAVFSYFVDAALILIIALLMIRRHAHHSNTVLFEALDGIVTTFTSFFLFLLLFAMLLPLSVATGWVYVYSAVTAMALILVKDMHHRLRDLTTAVSSIGVGLVLGLNFPLSYAIFLMGAVAVYDYIAVFKTSEMADLARSFSSQDLSFLISVSDLEPVSERGLSQKEIIRYIECLAKDDELDDPRCRAILKKGELPAQSSVSLGEGDLSLPLMVIISAYASFSHAMALAVLAGAIAGIFATMALLKAYKRPIPAIPPLFSCIGLFAGSALLLIGGASAYAGALLVLACALVMLVDIVTISKKMRDSAAERSRRKR